MTFGTIIDGLSTNDQKGREGLSSIMKVYIMSDRWVSKTSHISLVNRAIKFASISSTCPSPGSITTDGLKHTFPRKRSLNSLVSWAKEPIESNF